jgi:hypothetical protein
VPHPERTRSPPRAIFSVPGWDAEDGITVNNRRIPASKSFVSEFLRLTPLECNMERQQAAYIAHSNAVTNHMGEGEGTRELLRLFGQEKDGPAVAEPVRQQGVLLYLSAQPPES